MPPIPPYHTRRVIMSWSGGKDSAMALADLVRDPRYEVVGLLTTVAEEYKRVSHHGVREELLDAQAAAIGLPLDKLYLPATLDCSCANSIYEDLMSRQMARYLGRGIRHIGFGDIFLEDLRRYREDKLASAGVSGVFPLWKQDTAALARRFIADGYRACLTCVDGQKLGESFAGRAFDQTLLDDLPHGMDPCGENGEFHSYVWDGPVFRRPIGVEATDVIARDVRYFAEVVPCGIAVSEQSR